MSRRPSLLASVLIAPIRFYQRFITPYTPASCRFYPTCSSYAVSALREHGALRGSWLTIRRLGRCHPWSAGGIDYVPPRRERIGVSGSSVSVSSPPQPLPAAAPPPADSAAGPAGGAPWNVTAPAATASSPACWPFTEFVRHPADALPTDRSTAA